MWAKIKSFIPGVGEMVKILVVIVIISAIRELVGGVFASFILSPVATTKALIAPKTAASAA